MPGLDDDGWQLDNAEERHAAAPTTFEIPSLEERSCICVGQTVRLLFLFLNHEEAGPIVDCERMWVEVTAAHGGRYSGRLDSEPVTSDRLSLGDLVSFGPEHIAAVYVPTTDPRHPDHRPAASRSSPFWRH